MMLHLFVSFKSSDTLIINNIPYEKLYDRIASVCNIWHRTAHIQTGDFTLLARFYGRPFSATGPDSILVQRMILRLFQVLGNEGYISLTSVHTGSWSTTPQLVFVRSTPDTTCTFFSMSMSEADITFVGAPEVLIENLTLTLNGIFRKTFEDEKGADGVYAIRRRNGYAVDKNHFYGVILKYFNDSYLKLEASVALGRTGLFGFGPRKEVWVFKGSDQWRPTEKR